MRIALVSPPTMHPTSPPLGPAVLSAFLQDRDPELEVCCFDLNLCFYRTILRLINEEKFSIRLYNWSEKQSRIRLLEAVSVISDSNWPEGDLSLYHSSASIFLSFENIFNGFMEEMARRLCLNMEVPARIELFFQELIQPVLDFAPQLFGISVQFSHQLSFAPLLLKLCREHLATPTVLGGAWAGVVPHPERLFTDPMNLEAKGDLHPFQMNNYLDYIIPGEAENGLLELSKMVREQREADQVPNLIYLEDGFVRKNTPSVITDLSRLPVPDFSSFELDEYFVPRPVLPLQLSRGCPWARCTFCTHHHSYLSYRQLSLPHCIDYLSVLKEKYQCTRFSFVDEMILPHRFHKLAESMIESDLHISYAAYAKPSVKFSLELLETIRQSGCRVIMWGLESASQRILDLMDKGTRVGEVEKVIRRSDRAGLVNLIFVLFGFPTETEEEFHNTLSFLEKNHSHIHALAMGTFVLTEGSRISRHPKDFSLIVERQQINPIRGCLDYKAEKGMTPERVDELFKKHLPELDRIGISRRLAGYRDHLLLWAAANSPPWHRFTPEKKDS